MTNKFDDLIDRLCKPSDSLGQYSLSSSADQSLSFIAKRLPLSLWPRGPTSQSEVNIVNDAEQKARSVLLLLFCMSSDVCFQRLAEKTITNQRFNK